MKTKKFKYVVFQLETNKYWDIYDLIPTLPNCTDYDNQYLYKLDRTGNYVPVAVVLVNSVTHLVGIKRL